MSYYVVAESAACMPSSCWGRYRRVAVLEMADGAPAPKMISERARGVVRVVRTWEKRADGLTERCAAARARVEAAALVRDLTAKRMAKANLALGWSRAIGLEGGGES